VAQEVLRLFSLTTGVAMPLTPDQAAATLERLATELDQRRATMYNIDNGHLKLEVNNKGAELSSIYSHETGLEYLWGGVEPWPKKSPVLFPIVGTLKKNAFYYNDKEYILPRHGFARDMEFTLTAQSANSLTFTLESNEETLAKFPFVFRFDIVYALEQNTVSVQYRITNTGESDMYFSVGGHPAFKIPLEPGIDYEDYHLEFSKEENALRWLISPEGLINPKAVPVITNSNILPLTRDLFLSDAVVMKYLNSDLVKLKTDKSDHGIEFHFPGFPFLGLWAAKNADFVCIEPWCGIADSTTSNQQLINKEGINLLTAGHQFERGWSVKVY
jgi:galactose mutarotase-like enzyme